MTKVVPSLIDDGESFLASWERHQRHKQMELLYREWHSLLSTYPEHHERMDEIVREFHHLRTQELQEAEHGH